MCLIPSLDIRQHMTIRTTARRVRPREYQRQPVAQNVPIPAPSLGMNTRDGVSSLDIREARSIRNMIVENGKLRIRKGKTSHTTITGASSTGSMFVHEGVSANVILAAADGEIWDVTGVTASVLTSASYTSDTWSIVQFNDTAIGVNGADTPWAFDGSTVGASGFSGSGLTIANLRTVNVVGTRLWFTEVDKADVWYGDLDAVTGTLTKFQLSQQTKGGYCAGIFGYGVNIVFVMSSGEIVTYQGDVEDTNGFARSGTYDAPRPIGYNCGLTVGNDLVLITQAGPLPFEYIISGVAFDSQALQHWGKISPSFVDDYTNYGSYTEWNGTYSGGLVI